MAKTVTLQKEEYETLKHKAELLDNIMETEGLTEEEIKGLEEARLGRSLTEEEFIRKHPELEENV